MSKIEQKLEEVLTLPPNVKDISRGTLEFQLETFKWKGNKTFPSIQAKIRFWGQDSTSSANIFFHGDKPLEARTLKYSIVTCPSLFQSYLHHSNPIQIRLFSLKTENLIGSCVVRLPDNILHLSQERSVESSPIFSQNGFILGTIVVSLKLTLNKMVETKEISPRKIIHRPVVMPESLEPQRTSTKDGPQPNFSEFLLNNIPSISSIETESDGSSQTVTDTQKSLMLDYLTGKFIPSKMEHQILQEICTLSPAASLINMFKDLTNESCQPPLPAQPKTKHQLSETSAILSKKIDSIKFAIHGFLSTKSGIKQIMKKISTSKVAEFNIVIECQICGGGSVFKQTENNTMYFISKVLAPDDLITKIEINKQVYRALKDPQKFFNNGVFLTYILWIRDAKSKISYILGASRIPIGNFLQEKLITGGKIAIKAINSETVVGVLKFQVELGCRTMTFGSEQQINEPEISSKKTNETQQRAQLTFQPSKSTLNTEESSGNSTKTTSNSQTNEEEAIFSSLLYFGAFKQSQGREICIQLSFFDLIYNDFVKISSTGSTFNFLRVLPVQINEDFLSKMKHNFILVEAYEGATLVASIKLPLHQFFIAFRDSDIRNHVGKAKLPVISIDGWNNLLTSAEMEVYGQVQVILAVGTEFQIETLKVARGLSTSMGLPTTVHPASLNKNAETQTTPRPSVAPPPSALSSFIESLAAQKINGQTMQKPTLNTTNGGGQQMKNTADLLDMLQKALQEKAPPKPQLPPPMQEEIPPKIMTVVEGTQRVLIEIERAQKLPMIRLSKKQKQKIKAKGKNLTDVEPSAYVTFEAEKGNAEYQVKSHEGLVYTTHVCERTCDPVWQMRFEVDLPKDIFHNVEKNFILKVWRKSPTLDSSKLTPTPLQDAVIGFSAVNIKELACGLPSISNWFNIIDFNGRCNGQVKIHISLQSTNTIESHPLLDDEFNTALSRALKRKFTELEGISQRLKARLLDVTTENDNENNDDDEFERDLNTVAEEDAIGEDGTDDFAWLGSPADVASENGTNDLFRSILEGIPSTSAGVFREENIQQLSTVLKKTSISEDDERQNPEGGDTDEHY